MSNFPILDLVIGMIFIYFLLSIICSSGVELWFSLLKTRARLLEKWLERIFNRPALDSDGNLVPVLDSKKSVLLDKEGKPVYVTLGQSIMNHCMVTALSKNGKSTSYIDANNFVTALLDKITVAPATPGQLPPTTLAGYITAIQNSTLVGGELKRTILSLANEALQAATAIESIPVAANITNNITTPIKSELDHFRGRLEKWYDTNTDRLTGTLKRTKALPTTIILAIIITVGLNTDSVEISKYLYNNKDAGKQIASSAMNTYQNYKDRMDASFKRDTTTKITDSTPTKPLHTVAINELNKSTLQLKQDIDSLNALDLPIGWNTTNVTDWKTFWNYFFQLKHIAGWLATILAICLGAPFWFDILSKIANLRGAGPKPSSSSNADTKNS